MGTRKLLFLMLALLAGVALASGVTVDPSVKVEFTDCLSTGLSSDGGAPGQLVRAGPYVMRVTDENTWICFASTCASSGDKFPVNTVMLLDVLPPTDGGYQQYFSCRSASSTGDLILTKATTAQ